jgi:hypothetical protein
MEVSATDEYEEALYWETMATTRRYVRYTSGVEKMAILKAQVVVKKRMR